MSSEDALDESARVLQHAESREIRLATYNVLDLFLPSPRQEPAFVKKLEVLAGVLAHADADLVGIQEVGEPEALERLLETLRTRHGERFAYRATLGTPDARGIRNVALTRLPMLACVNHTAEDLSFPTFVEGDPPPFLGRLPLRRSIVQVTVATGLGPVHLFVLHFKSNRPLPQVNKEGQEVEPRTARERGEAQLRALAFRSAEALYVRGLIDDVIRAEPGAHVAVAGDFNDVEASPTLGVLRTGLTSALTLLPPAERYSARHDGDPKQIDHLLLSTGLARRLLVARVLREGLVDVSYQRGDQERVPKAGSDHALLCCALDLEREHPRVLA